MDLLPQMAQAHDASQVPGQPQGETCLEFRPEGIVARTPSTRAATTTDAAVGQRIRRLRVAAGRSQRDLAEQLGITTTQIHRYEVGVTRVAASRLVAIADALGVMPNELLGTSQWPASAGICAEAQELLFVFNSIVSQRHRSALLQMVRSMASAAQTPDESRE